MTKRLTIDTLFRHTFGMDKKARARLESQITNKQKQLEALVQQGVPLTDPSMLALSRQIDRLIIRVYATTDPPKGPTDSH